MVETHACRVGCEETRRLESEFLGRGVSEEATKKNRYTRDHRSSWVNHSNDRLRLHLSKSFLVVAALALSFHH